MIYILHYVKDPEPWELWIALIVGNAGFISATVLVLSDGLGHGCMLRRHLPVDILF